MYYAKFTIYTNPQFYVDLPSQCFYLFPTFYIKHSEQNIFEYVHFVLKKNNIDIFINYFVVYIDSVSFGYHSDSINYYKKNACISFVCLYTHFQTF